MSTLTVSEAREGFPELVNRAHYRKERTVVTKHGKRMAALVPVEDLELLIELEARIDLEKAREALKEAAEGGTVSWNKLKDELKL